MAKVLSSISLDSPASPVSSATGGTFTLAGTPGFTGTSAVQRYDLRAEVNPGGTGWVAMNNSTTGLRVTTNPFVSNSNSTAQQSVTVTCATMGSYSVRIAGAPTSGGSFTVFSATQTVSVFVTQSGSLTANAVIKRNSGTKTFTADAIIKRTNQSASFTANAVVPTTTPGTFTANAIILHNRVFTQPALVDATSAVVTGATSITCQMPSYQIRTDVVLFLLVNLNGTNVGGPVSPWSTTNAAQTHVGVTLYWRTSASGVWSGSTFTVSSLTSGDWALFGASYRITDSYVASVIAVGGLFEVVPNSTPQSGDVAITNQAGNVTMMAVPGTVTASHTAMTSDSDVYGSATSTNTLSSVTFITWEQVQPLAIGSGETTVSSWTFNTAPTNYGGAAYVELKPGYWSLGPRPITTNAVIDKPASFTADAVIYTSVTTVPGSFTTDAVLLRNSGTKTFTANAVLKKTGITGSFTADAVIKATSGIYYGTAVADGIAGVFGSTSVVLMGQSFTPSITGSVSRVEWHPLNGGTATDSAVLELQSDSAGIPSGTVLSSLETVAAASLGTDLVAPARSISTSVAVTSGTTYWLVASRTGTLGTIPNVFGWSEGSNDYAGGVTKTYTGVTWFLQSTDLLFLVFVSFGFTADAVLLRSSGTKTFAADAVIRKTATGTPTADAVLFRTQLPTFTANAVLKKTGIAGSFTADAIIKRLQGSAVERAVQTTVSGAQPFGDSSVDQVAQGVYLGGYDVGSTLIVVEYAVQSEGSPVDNLIVELQTADATTKPTGTVVATIETIPGSSLPTTPTWRRVALTLGFSPVQSPNYGDFNIVMRRSGGLSSLNRYGWAFSNTNSYAMGESFTHDTGGAWSGYSSVDFAFVTTVVDPFILWADAVIASGATTVTGSFSADAVLKRTQLPTFTANAVLKKTGIASSFTADAITKKTASATFTADAVLLRVASSSIVADAVLRRTQSSSFTADALLVQLVWKDTFSRTVAAGWGGPDIGGGYSGPATISVGSGYGTTSASSFIFGGRGIHDGIVQFDLFIDNDGTANVDYRVSVGDWTIFAASGEGWQTGVIGVTNTGFSPAIGEWWTVRAAVGGGFARTKAWKQGTAEPDWAVSSPWASQPHTPAGVNFYAISDPRIDNIYVWMASGPSWTMGQLAADAVIRRTQSSSLTTADAVIQRPQSGSLTADAVLRASRTGSFTADAITKVTFPRIGDLSIAAHGSFGPAFVVDVAARAPSGDQYYEAALFGSAGRATLHLNRVDANNEASVTLATADLGPIPGSAEEWQLRFEVWGDPSNVTVRARAWPTGGSAPEWTTATDNYLLIPRSDNTIPLSCTIDWVGGAPTISADAVFFRTQLGNFTADAVLKKNQVASFPTDADIRRAGITGSFTADALLKRAQSSSFTALAVLRRAQQGTFGADALLVQLVWKDTFTRTVATGLGSPDIGGGYSSSGDSTSVNGSEGLLGPTPQSHVGGRGASEGLIQFDFIYTDAYWNTGNLTIAVGPVRVEMLQTKFGNRFALELSEGGSKAFSQFNTVPALGSRWTVKAWWGAPAQGQFRIKMWEAGQAEPDWNQSVDGTGLWWPQLGGIYREGENAYSIGIDNIYLWAADSITWTTGQVSADAVIRRTQSSSFTAAAVIWRTTTGSFTADAVFATGITTIEGSVSADAVTQATLGGSLTANANIRTATSGNIIASAAIQATLSGSATFDAVTKRTASATFTADAVLLRVASSSIVADADVLRTQTGSFAADAVAKQTFPASLTAGAVLRSTRLDFATADAILLRAQASSLSADAVIARAATGSLTANAVRKRTQSGSVVAAAVVRRPATGTLIANAVLKRTMPPASVTVTTIQDGGPTQNEIQQITVNATGGTWHLFDPNSKFSADFAYDAPALAIQQALAFWMFDDYYSTAGVAVTQVGNVYTFEWSGWFVCLGDAAQLVVNGSNLTENRFPLAADAVIKSAISRSLTANAVRKRTQSGAVTADAVTKATTVGTIAADAVTRRTQSATASADATIERTATGSLRADAWTLRVQTGSFATDAILFGAQSTSLTADAVIMPTFIANAIVRAAQVGSAIADARIMPVFRADAIVLRSFSGSITGAAWVLGVGTFGLSGDAVIFASRTGSFTADTVTLQPRVAGFDVSAILRATRSASLSLDAITKKTASASYLSSAVLFRLSGAAIVADAITAWTATSSLVADADIQRTASGATTADAVTLATLAGSFTASAIVTRTTSGTFSTDAVLASSQFSSTTADSTFAKVSSSTLRADSIISASAASTISFEAVLSKATVVALSIDAIILSTAARTFGSDSVISASAAFSFIASAIVRVSTASSLGADAVVRQTSASGCSADAVVRREAAASLTTDAIVLRSATASFTADAWLFIPTQTGSFAADAITLRTTSEALTASAWLFGFGVAAFAADAVIRTTATATATADAITRRAATGGIVADAITKRTASAAIAGDAVLLRSAGSALSGDAIVRRLGQADFTLDAFIRATTAGSFSASAVVRSTETRSFSAAALVKRQVSDTFASDATIVRVGTASFTADAVQQKTALRALTANAVALTTRTVGFDARAVVLSPSTSTFTADAALVPAAFTFTADALLLDKSQFAFSADASISRRIASTISATTVARTIAATTTALTIAATTTAATFAADTAASTIAGTTSALTIAATRYRRVGGTFAASATIE